jgi:hypothetical protein
MMLSLACVIVESFGLPSVMMWLDRGEDRCCGLSKGWNGGDSWIPLGVVGRPPRVRYGTACLLIRDAIGCESCSEVWEKAQDVF